MSAMVVAPWGNWWIVFFVMPLLFWRPWSRRRYPRPRDTSRNRELDEAVRARLELVDQLESRVSELENRLDFAERLLADRRQRELAGGADGA